MLVLLKNITIIDPSSSHHNQVRDILLNGEKIEKIGEGLTTDGETFDGTGLKVSQGWFDMRAFFADPGEEHKEDISSGSLSALKGGFTDVALLPNTKPVIQGRDGVSYVISKGAFQPVHLHPLGAVSKDCKGEALAEMNDMGSEGAVGFTDGFESISHTGILLKTLQYLQKNGGLLMDRPADAYLSSKGLVHEGYFSTRAGFPGIPSLAEEIAVKRNLDLLRYAGGRLHFSCISTKESVGLIREAKAEGLQVSCDVAVHQLAFDDSVIGRFDTSFKVNPPFRSESDIEALRKGLADGTIDVVVSDHNPQDIESKRLEFDYAEYGVISLETLFGALNSFSQGLNIDQLVSKITDAPRDLLNLEKPVIEEGGKASLTIFDTEKEWVVDEKDFASRSSNSPFLGLTLKGKAVAVANKGQFHKI